MDMVVKISKDYVNFKAQFIDPVGLNFSNQLINTGGMSFQLEINDSQIGEILEYKKVAVYVIENGVDQLVWTGYSLDPSNDSKTVTIECREEKDYLMNKMIFVDKDYTSTTIEDMLIELVNESNARDGGFNGNLTFETNVSMNAGKEFKAGTSYFQILSTVALLNDLEWTKSLNKIIVKDTIGEDKTSGSSQILLTSKAEDPNDNNVSSFLIKRNGKSVITSLLGVDSVDNIKKDGDTSIFGFIERSQRFDDGNLADQTQELVDKRSVSQREVTLNVISNFVDFRDIDVGDLIKLEIDHGSILTQVDDSLKIIEKTVSFVNKEPILDVKVSKEAKPIDDFANFVRKLRSDLDRLELQ